MATLRNFLIAVGLYYLSTWLAIPLSMVFPNAHVYGESPLDAIVLGAELGMGRAVAAACAGILVMLLVTGRKSERWAFVVAALYLILIRHSRSSGQLGAWDRMVFDVDIVFPAVLCVAAAYIVAHLQKKRTVDFSA